MILQSITKAIREQNYYAVALEFVIVIAGVVIGFQINAWNSERESAARAATLIERLGQETAAAFESHERDLGRLAQRNHELSLFNTVLSPLIVLLSLVLWGSLWGISGMFLCVPITVVLMIILYHFDSARWIAVALSKDGHVTPSREA